MSRTLDTVSTRFLAALAAAGHEPGQALGVAWSGGRDSTALLALAADLLPSESVWALHVDHGARPTSAVDAAACRRVAGLLGVGFAERRLDPGAVARLSHAQGLEAALRELRYAALADLCRAHGVAILALGHHADDALEGHLLALARGSGLVGQAGPRPERRLADPVRAVRPLLGLAPEALAADLRARRPDLPWVEDETNRDPRFARNRIRQVIVPVLAELAGGRGALHRAVATLREDRDALEGLIDRELGARGVDPAAPVLDLTALQGAHPRVRVEAIRRFVAAHSGRTPARVQVDRVLRASAEAGRTRWLDLPGLRLRVEAGQLSLAPQADDPVPALPLAIGQVARSRELGLSVRASLAHGPEAVLDGPRRVSFDLEALGPDAPAQLVLRGARPGDAFRPFGLGGRVRLLRWLAGQGIPRSLRPHVPIVVCGAVVLWVVGRRRADLAPLGVTTARRLVLEALDSAQT